MGSPGGLGWGGGVGDKREGGGGCNKKNRMYCWWLVDLEDEDKKTGIYFFQKDLSLNRLHIYEFRTNGNQIAEIFPFTLLRGGGAI